MADPTPALDLRTGSQRIFLHLLVSTLVVSVMNFTVWFAVTFWVYLETSSVFATGLIAGIFLVSITVTGIWFGSLVDHHHKKTVMQWSAAVSMVLYAVCLALYLTTPDATFRDPGSVRLWVFVVLLMLGVIAGNLRTIALPTLVTLLIPEDSRDKANGLVGSATGVSFLVTSVISGLLVAADGMTTCCCWPSRSWPCRCCTSAPCGCRRTGRSGSPRHEEGAGVDLRGTVRLVRASPDCSRSSRSRASTTSWAALHGAHGRLRPVPDVGAGLGPAVGRAERLHHRRGSGRRPGRAGTNPVRTCCW